jgi:hypothetical protein
MRGGVARIVELARGGVRYQARERCRLCGMEIHTDGSNPSLSTSLFGAATILIEDQASGTSKISWRKGCPVVRGIKPADDKIMPLHAQTATIENGFVASGSLLPVAAPTAARARGWRIRSILRSRSIVIGGVVVLIVVILALCAPYIAPFRRNSLFAHAAAPFMTHEMIAKPTLLLLANSEGAPEFGTGR